jgi:hypothetical protein
MLSETEQELVLLLVREVRVPVLEPELEELRELPPLPPVRLDEARRTRLSFYARKVP